MKGILCDMKLSVIWTISYPQSVFTGRDVNESSRLTTRGKFQHESIPVIRIECLHIYIIQY